MGLAATIIAMYLSAAATPPACGLARTSVSTLPQGVYGLAGAVDEGKGYFFGGQSPRAITNKLYVVERSRRPRAIPNEATPRRYHAIAVRGTKLYVFGGEGREGPVPLVEQIDVENGAVKQLAPFPAPRAFVSSAWHDGSIYVAGSERANGSRVGRVDIYDLNTDSWRSGPPLSAGRDAALVDVEGTLFAIGGYLGGGTASTDVEILRPGAERWVKVAALPHPTSAHSAAVVDGAIYVVGDYTAHRRTMRYEPKVDRWTVLNETIVPRRHTAALGLGDELVLVGGNRASRASFSPIVEHLVPSCLSSPPKSVVQCAEVSIALGTTTEELLQAAAICGAMPGLYDQIAEQAAARNEKAAAAGWIVKSMASVAATRETNYLVSKLGVFDLVKKHLAEEQVGSETKPIYVRSVKDEYEWLKAAHCPHGKVTLQKQTHTWDGLDKLEVSCGGETSSIYFDYESISAVEQGLKEEKSR